MEQYVLIANWLGLSRAVYSALLGTPNIKTHRHRTVDKPIKDISLVIEVREIEPKGRHVLATFCAHQKSESHDASRRFYTLLESIFLVLKRASEKSQYEDPTITCIYGIHTPLS